MNKKNKRYLYEIIIYIFIICFIMILNADFFFIKINTFFKITLIIITCIGIVVYCRKITNLGYDLVNGKEIPFDIKNFYKKLKNVFYKTSEEIYEEYMISLYSEKKQNNKRKNEIILIKNNNQECKNEQINIYKIIDKYFLEKKKANFFSTLKKSQVYVIFVSKNYNNYNCLNTFSKAKFSLILNGHPIHSMIIPVFISEEKCKAYITGFKYIEEYEKKYYESQKAKFINFITE